MKVVEKFLAVQKLGVDTAVPWEVWRCFGSQQKQVSICGTEISLGEDFVGLEQARKAIQWYVEQFGGSVKWHKTAYGIKGED